MTEALEKAFIQISKLPEEEQDTFAEWITQELESEKRWNQLFEQSQDILEMLADEALQDFRDGKTQELDVDNLE
jgi:hypothetical protein